MRVVSLPKRLYTDEEVHEIRQRYWEGQAETGPRITFVELADEYRSVSTQTISAVVNNRIYRDIPFNKKESAAKEKAELLREQRKKNRAA